MTTTLHSFMVPGLVLSSILIIGFPHYALFLVSTIPSWNYFVYAYGSIKDPPDEQFQVTANFILADPELLSNEISSNMSEVLIDKYLLDKYLAHLISTLKVLNSRYPCYQRPTHLPQVYMLILSLVYTSNPLE